MRGSKREWWKLSYKDRLHASKKYKDTEKQIQKCKQQDNWRCVKRLKYILRFAWWGVKKNKRTKL